MSAAALFTVWARQQVRHKVNSAGHPWGFTQHQAAVQLCCCGARHTCSPAVPSLWLPQPCSRRWGCPPKYSFTEQQLHMFPVPFPSPPCQSGSATRQHPPVCMDALKAHTPMCTQCPPTCQVFKLLPLLGVGPQLHLAKGTAGHVCLAQHPCKLLLPCPGAEPRCCCFCCWMDWLRGFQGLCQLLGLVKHTLPQLYWNGTTLTMLDVAEGGWVRLGADQQYCSCPGRCTAQRGECKHPTLFLYNTTEGWRATGIDQQEFW